MFRYKVFMVLSGLIILFAAFASGQEESISRPQMTAADLGTDEFSRVLVLGTPHLRSYGSEFNRLALTTLLDRLEEFAPDMVGIEALAPRAIQSMLSQGNRYEPVLKQFAGKAVEMGQAAQKALGLDWPAAMDRAEVLFEELESENKAGILDTRKEAIVTFLATYDLYSALLQWQYLPEEERTNVPNLSDDTIVQFDELLISSNENITIGLALAVRQGLQRIHPIDDHVGKDDFLRFSDRFQEDMENNELFLSQPWMPFFNDMVGRQEKAYEAGDLLPFYEYVNSKEYGLGDIEAQWQLFFRTDFPSSLDRSRVALWEVRNLGIAAHIRRAMAAQPGSRMVVIIGASHRYFLETYLAQMMDVKVIQLSEIPK